MQFVITIDTEADDQWSAESRLTTRNLSFLPRFQALCERYGFKPTYLCTWEVVHAADFGRTLGAWRQRGACEIGAHLHPWSNPPYDDDPPHAPGRKTYPSELSGGAFFRKMLMLTEAIRQRAGVPPRSYRAGRWGFVDAHAAALSELDYVCDCSVTPLTSWADHVGAEHGGPDFRGRPVHPYMLGDLVEAPVTILNTHLLTGWRPSHRVVRSVAKRLKLWNEPQWFRPWPHGSGDDLVRVYEAAKSQSLPGVEMMFHSSELMPGGSPFWPDDVAVEKLYAMLTHVFEHARADGAIGATMTEFAEDFRAKCAKPPAAGRAAA